MKTYATRQKDIKHNWWLIDAKDKILGRVATKVANLLTGKHKAIYAPYLDTGDHCVVINARYIRVSGRKKTQKIYDKYSGYPGGRREITFEKLFEKKPTEIFATAVRGMLPKSPLGKSMIKKLKVYPEAEHQQKAQNPTPLAV